jgi:hypothetical protein
MLSLQDENPAHHRGWAKQLLLPGLSKSAESSQKEIAKGEFWQE